MNESALLTLIRNTLGRLPNVRLWRNNIGKLQDKQGRWIAYGVCNPGGADLIGFTSIIITPEMVGRKYAVLTCIETKTHRGRLTPEQQNFIRAVHEAGAFAGVARTVEEAQLICQQISTLSNSQREPRSSPPAL